MADCPRIDGRFVQSEPEQRSTADDAMDALNTRCIRLTTYAGQLSRLLREANVEVPTAVAELNPDIPDPEDV